MSSVNKIFPKDGFVKISVSMKPTLGINLSETGSCALFYHASPCPFFSGLRIFTKSSSIQKIFACFPVGNFVQHTTG